MVTVPRRWRGAHARLLWRAGGDRRSLILFPALARDPLARANFLRTARAALNKARQLRTGEA